MNELEVPEHTEPTTLPAPTIGLVPVAAQPPPPPMRVPAVPAVSLPPLAGVPIVPPMPRLSFDDADDAPMATSMAAPMATSLAGATLVDAPVPAGAPGPLAEPTPMPPTAEAFAAPVATPHEPDAAVVPPDVGDDLTLVEAPPTTETPVLDPAPESTVEPTAAPAFVVPTLPSAGGTPPPSAPAAGGPGSHQPSQTGLPPVAGLVDTFDAQKPAAPKQQRRVGRAIVRTALGIVLAGAIGAGAHLGYDWWEAREAGGSVANVDGSDLASWPQVDPPAIRYTDTVTVFRTVSGVRTLTTHREISSGRTQAVIANLDAEGNDLGTVEVDVRGDEAFVRPTPDAEWTTAAPADAIAQIGDTWTTDVFTVRELFPFEALPYTTVLESTERVLAVGPLAPAVTSGEGAAPIAISTDPTSMVWQYRVIVDVDSFRANETVAFQEWSRRLGRNAVPRIEAWVDATGVVRQLSVDVDGTVVTHTLVAGSANSTRFDGNPLLDDLAATPDAADPASEPAPNSTEAGE